MPVYLILAMVLNVLQCLGQTPSTDVNILVSKIIYSVIIDLLIVTFRLLKRLYDNNYINVLKNKEANAGDLLTCTSILY